MEKEIIAYIAKDIGSNIVTLYKSKPTYSELHQSFYPNHLDEKITYVLNGVFDNLVREGECVEIAIRKTQNNIKIRNLE